MSTSYTSLYAPNGPARGLPLLGLFEKRFPLATTGDIPALRRLWEKSKDMPWNPTKAIPYESFDRSKFSQEQLDAGRLCWSRRAWTEYTGIIEVPAMLIRLCIDGQMPIHAKFCLAAKIMEEARHCEASIMLADAMGGYVVEPPPGDAIMRMVVAGFRDRMALNPAVSPEAAMTAWHIISEGIALDIFAARYKKTTEPVTREVIRLIMQDEVRHVEMGWEFLEHQVPKMTPQQVKAIEEVVVDIVENVEMKGFHSMCLLTDSETSVMRQAEAIAAEARLGFCSAEEEHLVFVRSLEDIRKRLGKFGIRIPRYPELEKAA
jgi:hypothetical protein